MFDMSYSLNPRPVMLGLRAGIRILWLGTLKARMAGTSPATPERG
jgi:hypothetical protein